MILRYETVFDGTGGESEIIIPSTASLLKVEVTSGNLTIKGKFDRMGDLQVIGGIKSSDFSTVLSIDAQGIYSYDVSGFYKINLNYTGTRIVRYKIIG